MEPIVIILIAWWFGLVGLLMYAIRGVLYV